MSRPAVIFGGPSPEHDISVSTGLQACHVLDDVYAIYWSLSGRWFLVDPHLEVGDFAEGVPRKARELTFVATPDGGFLAKRKPLEISVAVLACHGAPGEDGTLQAALDLAQIRYTGPGAAASALGMDKYAFGAVVAAAGLPTLPRVLLTDTPPGFDPPYIVKPRFGGSSIGIEVVDDHATAVALAATSPNLADGAVLEPFIADARDLQIGVRTHPELDLSLIEAPVRGEGILGYREKYLAWGGSGRVERQLPADLPADLVERIHTLARRVGELVGLRSVARIDFLERNGEVWVNEVNTIPGSLAAYLWPNLERRELLEGMIAEAAERPPRRFTTAGADGLALRAAGSVAAKLG